MSEKAYDTYAAVLDGIDARICALAAQDGKIIFANHSFLAAFGEDCIGQDINELLPAGKAMPVRDAATPEGVELCEFYMEDSGQWLSVRREKAVLPDKGETLLITCHDATPYKKRECDIQERAYTDYLTGLPNRHACDEELLRLLKRCQGVNTPGVLLFVDLDDFKVVNDSFGHDYGDGVLIAFASFLKQLFQGRNSIFRLGGDEFVVIIDPESWMNTPEYLEEMLERARRPWKALDKEFHCSLSIGVVDFIARMEDARSLLKKADIAMYHAKKMGKNIYAYYTEGLDSETMARIEIETLLRQAMLNDFAGFEILYQPYYSLNPEGSTRLEGCEALLRLRGRGNELLLPKEFIGLAEYLGLIMPIGDYVLRRAAEFCRRVNAAGYAGFSVTVNLSSAQFRQKDAVRRLQGILHDVEADPRNMIIGINEGIALNERNHTLRCCADFRRSGTQVAMDDFGAGPSSFINMRELPVDIIKIAPMYLQACTDNFAGHFIRLLADLGHCSDKKVCLCGVETAAQLEFCRELRADLIQGFLLNAPDSEEKLLRELAAAPC